MRQANPVSPLNPLPVVLWALALPAIAGEIVFLLGQTGLIGGAQGVGGAAGRAPGRGRGNGHRRHSKGKAAFRYRTGGRRVQNRRA